MAYRALYRKYRPAAFGEMIGQEHITTILKNQVAAGQTAHAYLFAGSRGTGKTSAAKILARAVNCEDPADGEPCGKCSACLRTAVENVDIIELDAASNNGVDDVRDIIDKARFMPLELRIKVYIIDEAHALSANAFNALLKTLEEPPAHVMFILATTEPHKIPATIISRCQRMDFHRLSVADMVRRMREILVQVGASIDDEGMLAIARAAEGGMRDCLSLADQCLSFCGNNVTAADVYSVLGSMDEGFLYDISDALIDSNGARALELLDRVVNDGRDLKVFVHDLAMHMRALLITRLCGHCSDILDCTEDAMRRYELQAARAGETRLLRANELLLQTEGRLRTVTLPRVLIESTLVRIARPEEQRTVDDLVERIEKLEQQLREGVVAAPSAPAASAAVDVPPFDVDLPKPTEKPAPKLEEPAKEAAAPIDTPAKALSNMNAAELWKAVTDRLYAQDRALAVIAINGKRCELSGNMLEVGFTSAFMQQAMSKPECTAKLQAALDAIAPGYALRFVLDSGESLESKGRELFGSAFRTMD